MTTKKIDGELSLKNKETPYKIVCPQHQLTPIRHPTLNEAMLEFEKLERWGYKAILTFNKDKLVILKYCSRKTNLKERRI